MPVIQRQTKGNGFEYLLEMINSLTKRYCISLSDVWRSKFQLLLSRKKNSYEAIPMETQKRKIIWIFAERGNQKYLEVSGLRS